MKIFVFGSNLEGRHGKGAALEAKLKYGALYGQGTGRQGYAYAIPTKGWHMETLPLHVIESYVRVFIEYALDHQELEFQVTRVGCGLAGYTDTQIAPMFANAPENCHLPFGWRKSKKSKIAVLDTIGKIMAVTGHRPDKLGGYGEDLDYRLIEFAKRMLAFYGPREVITGMALGWDQAVAYACNAANIPYVAAVPFEGQESKWPMASQMRYQGLIQNAKRVVIVCAGDYAVWKMQARNQWMVDNCDFVVALWNGGPGGTANCVQYAQMKQKPIKQVWASWTKPR